MAGSFPVHLTEEDVRRLCGATNFQWGDIFQREDHVADPTIEAEGLRGNVLGAWRRVDDVTVSATGGQVRSNCTCNQGELCRHAAALLLQRLSSRQRPREGAAAPVAAPAAVVRVRPAG